MSPVNLTQSAYKHGFSIEEAIHVIGHPVRAHCLGPSPRGERWVWLGYPHPGSDRPVEVIEELIPPRTIEVFHVSDLTDIYRDLWEEAS